MDDTMWGISWMVCAIFMAIVYIVRSGGQEAELGKLKKENRELRRENVLMVKKLVEHDKREVWRKESESKN